jgi:hypothetical protein
MPASLWNSSARVDAIVKTTPPSAADDRAAISRTYPGTRVDGVQTAVTADNFSRFTKIGFS